MDRIRDRLIRERDLDISCLMPGTVQRVKDERLGETGVPDARAYARLLDSDAGELDAFVRALVRQPDSFFGDESLTVLLRDHLLPQMLARKKAGDRIRVWVPNVGPGYLAYDIAMLLWKLLGGTADLYDLKVIATDSDPTCADMARFQQYPLDRFADLADQGWPLIPTPRGPRFDTSVRRLLVIGEHDALTRPPYPRIDLVVCRGLLPLLDAGQRAQLKSRLVYSLVLGGRLVLGRGERIGFEAEEAAPGRPFAVFTKQIAHPFEVADLQQARGAVRDAHLGILDRLQWPTLVVEREGRIVHANQAAGRELAGGEAIEGRNVSDLTIDEPQRNKIMETARDSLKIAQPLAITRVDGWAGSSVPLLGESRGLAAVVLVRAEDAPATTETQADAVRSAKAEIAQDAAETVAEMWTYDEDVRRLHVQAAAITDSLYNQTQELNRLKNELESRNAELQIANQELQDAIIQREQAESEVRIAFEREHRIADTLQKALLAPIPESIPGFTLAARYVPAYQEAEVAGDFYHAARLADGRFFLALGDVAGKGLDAAVYAYMAKYMLLAYVHETPEPEILLLRLNEGLAAQNDSTRFVTLVYLLFDVQTGVIRYASAGHEPSILCSPGRGEVVTLDPTGGLLGAMQKMTYESVPIELEPGGSFLLYTDGLSDAGKGDNRLNTEGIARIMAEHCCEPPARFLDILYDAALSIGKGRLTDDATAVLIKRAAE